ncbi:MAG: GNAT family N-acetyltransferase [Anaerolineales bacterium]|nr:GNAT family N-acetyltransferase [Anaerolineales bacterium]
MNESDRVIGCGQVKPHMDGSRELASVVVEEEWRRQGIASHLIKSIMSGEKPPLWLTCRRELTGFYAQLGFTEVERDEDLSPYFTRISNFLKVYHQLIPGDLKISIMVWFGETGESKRL